MVREQEQERFDELAVAVAERESRRGLLGRVGGGSLALAALLAATGLGLADDEAEAKKRRKCKKKCKKKNSKRTKRKCKKRCKRKGKRNDDRGEIEELLQTGSATLTPEGESDCVQSGQCTDTANGTLTGTPIADGAFEGTLTGTNFNTTDPSAVTADYNGAVTATETSTGDTLLVDVLINLTLDSATGVFTFTGSYAIAGGTGRFAGATGSGTVSGNGTRTGLDEAGEVESFTLKGDIVLA